MERAESIPSHSTRCSGCRNVVASYDIIHYGSIEKGYRELCGHCFNMEAAELAGLEKFEHLTFEPVRIEDCSGKGHEFHFRTRLFGPGVAIDALEIRHGQPSGYHFQIIGDPAEDLLAVFGLLIEKVRRALSIRHVEHGEYGLQIADRVVRARIGRDEAEDGRVPLVVVDGREITWDQFGRMLMSFEGWQFKL